MSLSTCEHCGGNIPLGPDASNRCETCGLGLFDAHADPFPRGHLGDYLLQLRTERDDLRKRCGDLYLDMHDVIGEMQRLQPGGSPPPGGPPVLANWIRIETIKRIADLEAERDKYQDALERIRDNSLGGSWVHVTTSEALGKL